MGLGPVDALVETFGPFILPVLVFTVGLVGYLGLLLLNRLVGRHPSID